MLAHYPKVSAIWDWAWQVECTTICTTVALVPPELPLKSCVGVACLEHDSIKAAKQRNILVPSLDHYITFITIIMRTTGLEKVVVILGVFAVL